MVLVENKKARFDYEIIDEYEAGIKLSGFEVKAIRAGKVSLMGGRVIIRGGETYLIGVDIQPYQAGNEPLNYERERNLKLIIKKKEIEFLKVRTEERGLTLVPIKMYNKGGLIKLSIGLAKKKKKGDKREAIREREDKKKIRQKLKNQIRG